ncbi:hypothetical protein P0240_07980 [Enterobacter cloacae]|uniref:hypothetical protein n=1 Tax=Enterobacter cloacae TaxID=550 RepID=UPI00100FC5A5|nr:hypothetical protein [Enterobacter cloacae]MCM7399810.1 hypothetical protein [Enterobacter cloacae]QGN43434.1 hypothetical protein GJ694_15030 [Enterobacter cloacae]RXX57042.1 hypothetical protein DD601_11120 [Enterobacter cloacae]
MTTNNHPAHGPVSLDRLHQISEILSKAAAQSDGGNLGYAMADAVKVIDEVLAIPETLPCPVLLEPGLKFGKGVHTRFLLAALRRRADYYAELEAMTLEQLAEHDAGISEFKAMLGTSKRDSFKMPEELLSAMEEVLRISDRDHEAWHKARNGIASYRDAMLQDGNSPTTPDGYVLVPNRLTAENGAKGVLSGEFSETKFINCPECFGDDECETCDGSGRIEITVPVTWTTIKAIWAKGVEHFAAAPQQHRSRRNDGR